MASSTRLRCPQCGRAVELHCNSGYCTWHRCPAPACKAVISFRLGRGIQHLPGDVRKPFVFTPTGPPGG